MKAVVLGLQDPETENYVELTIKRISDSDSVVILQLKEYGLPKLEAEVNVQELVEALAFVTGKRIVS